MDPSSGIPQDDFKWFGEGFSGFPKRLPEDCVEYAIYIIPSTSQTESQTRERLRSVEAAASVLTKKYLKQYIWQRDGFGLSLVRKDGVWLLRGRTNYGDSVADEWLVVYLLRELSRQFADAWIRVYDTDGEFLLIEAANALPKWLNPEVAENRIWLNNGQLRIIPLSGSEKAARKAGSDGGALTLEDARTFIKTQSSELIHSPSIEEEAFYRIRNYPAEISQNLHHALLTLPRKLASIIHAKPAYISAAVEAFYLRDPIALRPLKTDNVDTLKFPPKDLVTTSVRFTKVGYAQLKSQEFDPPRPWADVLMNNMHPSTFGKVEMGMKVACGFEMLVADPQNRDKKTVREINLLVEDIDSGEEALPTDAEVEAWGKQEDDEDWMDINFEDFEKELAGRKERGPSTFVDGGGFGDKAAQENLRKMVQRFDTFLKDDEAGAEGAEVDEMDFDNDEKRWLDDDEEDDSDDEDEEGDGNGEREETAALEAEFTKMMCEMMGMPAEVMEEMMKKPLDKSAAAQHQQNQNGTSPSPTAGPPPPPKIQELSDSDTDSDPYDPAEMAEMQKVMAQMEAELREAGALDLDPAQPSSTSTAKGKSAIKGKGKATTTTTKPHTTEAKGQDDEDEAEDDSADEDILDPSYNLAKNMLEAFRAQAGTAGPAGNMLAAMGLKLPRDAGEGELEER